MKKIFFGIAFIATALLQKGFAQDTTNKQLLTAYYNIKDALVNSNASSAAANASELIKAINITDPLILSKEVRANLLKDAGTIAAASDIKLQRERFASLSNNMFELAKAVKLSPEPVYQQYCPMKKASWLSNSKAIKNPYFGSAMLTCGSIKTTL